MILDTSFLIDLMNGEEAALEKAAEIDGSDAPQRIPLLVLYELYIGVAKGSMGDREQQKILRVVRPRLVTEIDESLAMQAGLIDGGVQADRGGAIGAVDATIAATALRFDEPVVTRDPGDFSIVADVAVETY